jgi:RNA polymerase sigma-70 factor (ECF subfamily)
LDTKHASSDEELAAEAAREGAEGPAFSALYARFEERVWRVCYRLMGSAEDAADAAQEVFVQLFLQRAKFAGRSKYATWVHGIALRVCLSQRRSRGRRKTHESAAQVQQTARDQHLDRTPDRGTALDLAQMLDTLEDEERALLILKYAEGYSYEELAEMFDLSVSACKMRIHRAIGKLRERFPDQHFGATEED